MVYTRGPWAPCLYHRRRVAVLPCPADCLRSSSRQWWRRCTTNHGSRTCGSPSAGVRRRYTATLQVKAVVKAAVAVATAEREIFASFPMASKFPPCQDTADRPARIQQTDASWFCLPINSSLRRSGPHLCCPVWSGCIPTCCIDAPRLLF